MKHTGPRRATASSGKATERYRADEEHRCCLISTSARGAWYRRPADYDSRRLARVDTFLNE